MRKFLFNFIFFGFLAIANIIYAASGDIKRISVDLSGQQGNGNSKYPSISSDGRFVVFESLADNLVTQDLNYASDVFVCDRLAQTHAIKRISVGLSIQQRGARSNNPSISSDGRFVAFESLASNLVPKDTNGRRDIFVYNRQTKTIERISIDSSGQQGNKDSNNPSISSNGRFVAFESLANNLVPKDTNGRRDIFVYDRQTKTIERISIDSSGQHQGNNNSNNPSISSDGRFVAFESLANNLVPKDTNGRWDIFVYDRQTKTIERISIDSSGLHQGNNHSNNPSISSNGRFVAFGSLASNLVPKDTNGRRDIFVYGRQTKTIERISLDSSGQQGNNHSNNPSISSDGRFVAFGSLASNLVSKDTNGHLDIFIKELERDYNLYFPHIASNGEWSTEICIINTNKFEKLKGIIKAYNNAGTLLESKSLTLNTNGRKSILVKNKFSDPSNIGYIVLDSSLPGIFGYTKFHVNGKYRVAVPASSKINTKDIFIPHIASNNQWWTGLSLVNTTSSTKNINIEFDNGSIKTLLINGYEHRVFSVAGLFSNVPQPGIKSGVIKNAAGVIGLELFGSKSSAKKNYLSGILLKDETASNIYYPHIASNKKWWTGIVAYNPKSSQTILTITPFKSDGTKLQNKAIKLQGRAKYIGTAKTLNLPKETQWVHISAKQPITGFELFGTNNGKQLAGYTGVNISNKTGIFPKLEKNGWTGIAFVNITNSTSSVTIKAFDDAGKSIATKVLNVNAHGKIVGIARTLFKADLSNASYISYESNNDIVGFQLNGSVDNMLLDALPGN